MLHAPAAPAAPAAPHPPPTDLVPRCVKPLARASYGDGCRNGYHAIRGDKMTGYHETCEGCYCGSAGAPNPGQAQGQAGAKPRVLVMTVATHREPFIGLLEGSVKALKDSSTLLVAGEGEFFKGAWR